MFCTSFYSAASALSLILRAYGRTVGEPFTILQDYLVDFNCERPRLQDSFRQPGAISILGPVLHRSLVFYVIALILTN